MALASPPFSLTTRGPPRSFINYIQSVNSHQLPRGTTRVTKTRRFIFPDSPSQGTIEKVPPGMNAARVVGLASKCVEDMRIDLRGAIVLTEAATGAYAITPIIAALAGADRVYAFTRPTRFGTVEDVLRQTLHLAAQAGVEDIIEVRTDRPISIIEQADVITNSGHLRPIDVSLIERMKPTAVLPLMFEAWEIQAGRIDLAIDEARHRGIQMSGTNERHQLVDVFSYLGTMAVKHLFDAGTSVRHVRIAVVCDNPFSQYIESGLLSAGARVSSTTSIRDIDDDFAPEFILVSLTPTGAPIINRETSSWISDRWPDTIIVQFWGDIDRADLRSHGIRFWPALDPAPGHMAILPSEPGPEAVVRLQAGGFKVASVLRTPLAERTPFDLEFLDDL